VGRLGVDGTAATSPNHRHLSPNAGEALRMLSIPHDASALTRSMIEDAAHRFLDLGVGSARAAPNTGCVLVRSAELGAYVVTRPPGEKQGYHGRWVDAYWTKDDEAKVVDVTGAGNSFLGGVAAALSLAGGDVFEGTHAADS
jgi:sugar/nucleoside kinase (ribokinase family)